MVRAWLGILAMTVMLSGTADAADRKTLGWGRLFTNDFLGDGEDRWRSGSYAISLIRGARWQDRAPARMGSLIEYRFRSEIIAPADLSNPDPADRRYVGAISLGAHTHFTRAAYDLTTGVDLVFVGPQTRVDELQEELHDLLGAPRPNVSAFQVPDAVYPTAHIGVSRAVSWPGGLRARPFVELQAGVESLARVGFDLTLGRYGARDLLLRDPVSGQLYTGIAGAKPPGWSLTMGGDIAAVFDSRYLATPGISQKDTRRRVRIGLHSQWKAGAAFVGLAYLSPEFEGQREGQVTGSINLRFGF